VECGISLSEQHSVKTQQLAIQDFFEIAKAFSSTYDLDALLKKIGSTAEGLIDTEASSILLLDDSRRNLIFRTVSGDRSQIVKKQLIPIGQGIAGWVAQERKTVTINDVNADHRFTGQVDKVSGFVTRSILAVPMIFGDEFVGVCEVLNKRSQTFGPNDEFVLSSLANLAALSIINARTVQDQRNFFAHTIELLIIAVESQDSRTKGHSVRSAHLACAIGRRLGLEGEKYRDLYHGALLHDIGMIGLNDPQLVSQVTAGLTERTAEKLHPLLGVELLKGINILKGVIPIVRHHNECFDGTGHPDHLAGEAVPMGARILCFVEHVEALRMSGLAGEVLRSRVEQMAQAGSGTRFDPKVIEAYFSATRDLDLLRTE